MIEGLPKEDACTGCCACANVCPVNAICMAYSSDGFLVPLIGDSCIDCGQCVGACPSLNPRLENTRTPKFYSFCASDEIRKESSSGGMFTVLADYVLDKGGYVCGAAFDDNMQLKHVIVDSKTDLAPLRGSKYLQGNVEDCYKKIKSLLEEEKHVLFTGTPCQVAGLYGVLKRDYSNLITADLLCHGTPSQKFFDSYLEEFSAGKKVKSVQFRSKRFGWTFSHFVTQFVDGSEHVGVRNNDPYKLAFSKHLNMRWICYDCKFCDYPRQGDFTIGDLWESGKLDPKSNDKKGTSFVFVNNGKAEKIFREISANAKYYNEIKIDDDKYSEIPNRVTPKSWMHPQRERFLGLVKKQPFSKAVAQSLKEHYDIGLPCVLYGPNIGSVLTYFSLYNVLTDMGYTVLPIEKPLDASLENYEDSVKFVRKWLPEYSQPVQYDNLLDMRVLNDKCDMFVIGSDQIYLESMSNARGDIFFLQYINGNKKKIGYAVSFGGPGARGGKEYYDELKYNLNKFQCISCREDNGVMFANDELKLPPPIIQWALDPVFLCDKERFMALIRSVNKNRENDYIGAYFLVPRERVVKLMNGTKMHFRELPIECIGNPQKTKNIKNFPCECKKPFPIENALEMIYSSRFFITDSFHGMCFAIIFKKEFLVMPRDFPDRFVSLLKRIGLENRIISPDMSNFDEELFKPIDYDTVYEKLDVLIKASNDLLISELEDEIKPLKLEDIDIAMSYISRQNKQISEIQSRLDSQASYIDRADQNIQKLLRENNDLIKKNTQAQKQVAALRRNITDMENSRSWKLTKPLRAIKRRLHRIFRKGREQ